MNGIVVRKDPPVMVGFENEQQYREYLRVKQSLMRKVPIGIAS